MDADLLDRWVTGLADPCLRQLQLESGPECFASVMNTADRIFDGLRHAFDTVPKTEIEFVISAMRAHEICGVIHEDPFTRHAFQRPRGYPGDAALIDFLYGSGKAPALIAETGSRGQALCFYTRHSRSGSAVRERRDLLAAWVAHAARRKPGARILSIAAGHLREAAYVPAELAESLEEWIAIDQDASSIKEISDSKYAGRINPMVMSLRDLFKNSKEIGQFDLIYAAGLYDYLDLPVARKLTQLASGMLRPSGSFLFGNFAPNRKDEGFMRVFMDWDLIYRDEDGMRSICDGLDGEFSVDPFWGANREIVYASVARR